MLLHSQNLSLLNFSQHKFQDKKKEEEKKKKVSTQDF